MEQRLNLSRDCTENAWWISLNYYVARAEDVILGKLCYYQEGGSEKHLRGIMRISGEEVDTAYVSEWAVQLGVANVWQAVLDRLAKK